jgi:AcrR family transcriptional regulator
MKQRVRRRPASGDVRAAILEQATQLFADRGFEATTMQDLAARVGITAAGLYYYFPSKQVLLFEVLVAALRKVVSYIRAGVEAARARSGDDPAAELRALVERHVSFQLREVEESAVYGATFYGSHHLLNALSPEQRDQLRTLQRGTYDMLRAVLARGHALGRFDVPEPAPTAFAIIAMAEYVTSWFKPDGPLSAADVAVLHGDFALRLARADSMPSVGSARNARRSAAAGNRTR